MQRRDFLKSSLALTSLAAMSSASTAAEKTPAREYYELRRYTMRRGPMPTRLDDFFRDAAVPAWNRAGVERVGVFDVTLGPDMPAKYVLLTYKSLADVETVDAKFAADAKVAAADFNKLPATDPGYVRKESSLMVAFRTIPQLEVPKQTKGNQSRIFELRTYESHSKAANRKKVEMFDNGEIALFRRTGLTPVFFGETLVGPRLPNLTYLLVFDDMNTREQAWNTFRNDPEWKKMSSTPGFTDAEIVTNISNAVLKPTAYSQL